LTGVVSNGGKGRGGSGKAKEEDLAYNTCRREKAEKVLELVLVWIERALRICRKLCFQERLFD